MRTGNEKSRPGIDFIGVSVGAMILNDRDELFLSKRSGQATNERGCWETPGGKVEWGETLQDAVRREIREEYGIEIEIAEQFPAEDHLLPEEGQHWVSTTFVATIAPGAAPRILEPHKCDEIGWFRLDGLPSPLSTVTRFDLQAYERYRERVA